MMGNTDLYSLAPIVIVQLPRHGACRFTFYMHIHELIVKVHKDIIHAKKDFCYYGSFLFTEKESSLKTTENLIFFSFVYLSIHS